jgi:hypothetical protein
VSHPIPLHSDADLAVVLDDMRQDVAAWGDEGLVMRFFRASICLMLLSILDTLIELLADFRAGRLPPVLPAYDEHDIPAERAAASPRGPASRQTRAPGNASANTPRDAQADVPDEGAGQSAEPSAERIAVTASRRRGARLPPPSLTRLLPEPASRDIAWSRSRVPKWPSREFESSECAPTHAIFVTISKSSRVIPRPPGPESIPGRSQIA